MSLRRYVLVSIVLAALGVSILLWSRFRRHGVEGVLEASGQIRGAEITLRAKVPGRLEALFIREGQKVTKGESIAKISSEQIQARIEQAEAQVAVQKSRLKEVEASIKKLDTSIEEADLRLKYLREDSFHRIHQARAALQRADADVKEIEPELKVAKKDYERYLELVEGDLVSRKVFEEAQSRFQAAQAKVEAAAKAREEAKAGLQRAEASALDVQVREKENEALLDERARMLATREVAENLIDSAVAKLKEAEATFQDTEIHAPSGGTVITKLAEEGELMTEGTPVATLVDLSDIYVRVYIPEIDIGKIRIGNPARIYADSFPSRFFSGKVVEISQKAEFTPKEVHVKEERTKLVFGVKVQIENPEGYLKLGMPVDVKIKWENDVPW